MASGNDEIYKCHIKSEAILMEKYFVEAIWSKVDNLNLKFFPAASTLEILHEIKFSKL